MIYELTDNYMPEKLLHRDTQINQILNTFKVFKEHGHGLNLLIQGVSGSGKTTVVRKIIEENDNNIYTTCNHFNTSYKILKSIYGQNVQVNDNLIMLVINKLKKDPKILIIDEINKVKDIEQFFNELNTIYRETSVPIIIITNKRTIYNDMPDDARLTLFFSRVDFPAYNALELRDIIKQRLELLKGKIPDVPEAALSLICALGGKDSSARIILSLTLSCVLANDFSEEQINRAYAQMKEEEWRGFVRSLKPTEREFLEVLLDLQVTKKQFKSSDISSRMKDFTPSRISQLINTFENYGIITAEYLNRGRGGGKTRIIKFVNEYIFSTLEELAEVR